MHKSGDVYYSTSTQNLLLVRHILSNPNVLSKNYFLLMIKQNSNVTLLYYI